MGNCWGAMSPIQRNLSPQVNRGQGLSGILPGPEALARPLHRARSPRLHVRPRTRYRGTIPWETCPARRSIMGARRVVAVAGALGFLAAAVLLAAGPVGSFPDEIDVGKPARLGSA